MANSKPSPKTYAVDALDGRVYDNTHAEADPVEMKERIDELEDHITQALPFLRIIVPNEAQESTWIEVMRLLSEAIGVAPHEPLAVSKKK